MHLLVLPERHVDTFREIGEFPPDEAKRMLEFVAETARDAGLSDYRVQVNVGPAAGQTIFHLHWHVLGSGMLRRTCSHRRRCGAVTLIQEIEGEVKRRDARARRRTVATRCA